jgi:hypothetical protein
MFVEVAVPAACLSGQCRDCLPSLGEDAQKPTVRFHAFCRVERLTSATTSGHGLLRLHQCRDEREPSSDPALLDFLEDHYS